MQDMHAKGQGCTSEPVVECRANTNTWLAHVSKVGANNKIADISGRPYTQDMQLF